MNQSDELRKTFIHIMTHGYKNNTYKFALARFLLDYCKALPASRLSKMVETNETIIIRYEELADAFLRYYWHQEFRYRIKQNFYNERPPSVIKILRNTFGDQYIPEGFSKYAQNESDLVKTARKKILKKVFGHARIKTSLVVPRFQNVRIGAKVMQKNIFYDFDDDKQYITLFPQAAVFLNQNYAVLFKTVILEWSKFLEKINTFPRLIAKIETDEARRRSLTHYLNTYKDVKHCFYCNGTLNKMPSTHVDHFIPWSYIFEDSAWNLVLACQECNCKKSNSLAQFKFLNYLIERNSKYENQIPVLKKSLTMLDLGRGWEPEIKRHYNNCKDYGFMERRM